MLIAADTPQRITNTGDTDLVFHCLCAPRFLPENYVDLGETIQEAPAMAQPTDQWRTRLAERCAASGRSQRSISKAAGLGDGYVNSLLREGKTPTIENASAICRVLGISLSELLYGFELSQQTEEIVRMLEAQPEVRDGVLRMLRGAPTGTDPLDQ